MFTSLYVIIVKQGDASIGLLVDHVESVIGIDSEKIQSGIDLISGTEQASFLTGIAQTDMGLVILLSIEALLSEYDISEIEKFANTKKLKRNLSYRELGYSLRCDSKNNYISKI